jgi:hypothetical protein
MKSILYVGATLMIGASIYGFVDYKKSSSDREFTRMYESKESVDPDVSDKKATNPELKKEVIAEKKIIPAKKKHSKTAEPVEINSTSRVPVTPVETIKAETNTTVNTASLKESSTEKKFKSAKKKKLNRKMFSRGSMEDRYILKDELKLETPKKESVKAEIKEQ